MLIFVLPSSVSVPAASKVTTEPTIDPVVGVAWTIMLWWRLNPPRTPFERPAIRHSKLPEALPEEAIETLNATCENGWPSCVAVPPPAR
jgi:hypothetical protein